MLPSLRLIAATFLCGFAVAFAGLRLAAPLNDIHEGVPVAASHAAPLSVAEANASANISDHGSRGLSVASKRYDLHFALPATAAPLPPTAINVTALVTERTAPLSITPLLSIVPPDDLAKPPETVEAAVTENAAPVAPAETGAAPVEPLPPADLAATDVTGTVAAEPQPAPAPGPAEDAVPQ